jgi:DNA-binding NtrC family response regulator
MAEQPVRGTAGSVAYKEECPLPITEERELFSRAIQLAQGNQAKAARWLGITRTTMREKLSHFGLRETSTPEKT